MPIDIKHECSDSENSDGICRAKGHGSEEFDFGDIHCVATFSREFYWYHLLYSWLDSDGKEWFFSVSENLCDAKDGDAKFHANKHMQDASFEFKGL